MELGLLKRVGPEFSPNQCNVYLGAFPQLLREECADPRVCPFGCQDEEALKALLFSCLPALWPLPKPLLGVTDPNGGPY